MIKPMMNMKAPRAINSIPPEINARRDATINPKSHPAADPGYSLDRISKSWTQRFKWGHPAGAESGQQTGRQGDTHSGRDRANDQLDEITGAPTVR